MGCRVQEWLFRVYLLIGLVHTQTAFMGTGQCGKRVGLFGDYMLIHDRLVWLNRRFISQVTL
jgi:hypothetical protein